MLDCCLLLPVAFTADAPPFGQLMDIPSEAASFDPDGEFVRRTTSGTFAITPLHYKQLRYISA
jgi:hypothetical protein